MPWGVPYGDLVAGSVRNLKQLNMKLDTTRTLAADKGSRQEFALDGGLRIRVYPTGKATFAYRFRAPGTGTLRVITLLQIGDVVRKKDLEAAEVLFREAKAERAGGIDPRLKRDQLRADGAKREAEAKAAKADAAYTVRRLSAEYLDFACQYKRSWKEDRRIFEKYILPFIGDRPVMSIQQKDVRRVLGYLKDAPIMRDRTLACARAAWNWSTEAAYNPWAHEKIPQRPARDRVLTVAELRALLKRLDGEEGAGRNAVALILYTGCRSSEVVLARREEFDLEHRIWTIPAARMKTRAAHTVLLSKRLLELAKEILDAHESEWLFPSPKISGQPLSRFHAYKWLKQEANYTLHDIRTAFATWLGEAVDESGMPKYSDAVIDRCLAHQKRGVNRHYNFARLTEPARKGWADWADYLNKLPSKKVTSMRRKSAA